MQTLHSRTLADARGRGFAPSTRNGSAPLAFSQRPMPRAVKSIDTVSDFRLEALCYFLRNAHVFASLPEADVRDLATVATIRSLEKGAYLFHKDEPPPGLCIVRNGIVNLHRVAADGREVVIHFYRESETIPEFGCATKRGCPADARAIVASEVVIIPRHELLAKVRNCPELAIHLLASMDEQVHQISNSFEDIVSKNASTRFVHWLLEQCAGTANGDVFEFQLATTKRALASELGVRQETLSRTLRQLTDSGHLRVRGRKITVRNLAALRKQSGFAEQAA